MAHINRYSLFEQFLSEKDAASMQRCAQEFGAFTMYIQGPVAEGFGAGLVRRHDAVANYISHLKDPAEFQHLLARLNLFRGTYALHDELDHPLAAPMLHSPKFAAAAAALTGRPIVRPSMLYANILLPGQELAVHTDTPEYRGIDKWNMPEWFLVVMMHSGLFEDWRKHITAGVAFFGDCEAGEFFFYPDGAEGKRMLVPVRYNTAIHLDVDRIFHGVARVGSADASPPPIEPGMMLRYAGDDTWVLTQNGDVIQKYPAPKLRFSVQWKANCYADEAEIRLVESHADDLTTERVIDHLIADLRKRGLIKGERPNNHALATLMMDTYIRFPPGE